MATHQILKDRVAKAMTVLQAMPQSAYERPRQYQSAWPDMIRRAKRGAVLHRDGQRYIPNSEDISDCYKVIDGIYQLSDMQRTLICARAMDVAWHVLQNRYNRSRTHLNRLHQRALSALEIILCER